MQNPDLYQIRIKGHLNEAWDDWFSSVTITKEKDGTTMLTCYAIDQAALYGLLRQIRDMGLTLISVNRIEA